MNAVFKPSFRMNRWLWVGLAVIVVWLAAQQVIFKPVVEAVFSEVVGTRVTLGSFSLNIFTHQVRINNLQIYNEQGFPPKVFFNASEILVDINLAETLQGRYHFPLIVFRLDKMILFKNPQGKLNIDELKIVKEKPPEKNKGPMPNFKIDVLKLNIEQIIVEDDSQTPPLIEAYDLNLKDKTIRNVDSVPKLVGVLLVESLKPTAIRSAGLVAATTLLGVAFLPGLAVDLAISSDKAVSQISYPVPQVYQQSLQMVKRLGSVEKTDERAGQIVAKVYGCDVVIEIQQQGWNSSKVIIKARKYLLAKPEVAAGLLYQLKEELK